LERLLNKKSIEDQDDDGSLCNACRKAMDVIDYMLADKVFFVVAVPLSDFDLKFHIVDNTDR